MKFLEIPELGLLASSLSSSSQSVRVTTRIEAYSCKSVASERKMIKSLDQEFTTDLENSSISISPPQLQHPNSAFGRLDNKECRKTFWLLIATLNLAYPDHNFSHVKVEDFHRDESAKSVLIKMSESLELNNHHNLFTSSLGSLSISPDNEEIHQNSSNDLWSGVHPSLKLILNPVIDLSQCEIYSYYPDPDSDPHAVDSDEFDDTESVSSSIYGINKSDFKNDENTMFSMDEIDEPDSNNIKHSTLTEHHQEVGLRTFVNPDHSILNPQSSQAPRCKSTDKTCQIKNSTTGRSSFENVGARPNPSLSRSTLDNDLDLEEESAGGLLWSSHYFFYNKKMKRILFISIWGRKILNHHSGSFNESFSTFSEKNQSGFNHHISEGISNNDVQQTNWNNDDQQNDIDHHQDHKRRLSIFRNSIDKSITSGSVNDLPINQSNIRPTKKTRRTGHQIC
ncbi:hypothetical protein CROQUDRAFT_52293 [Cronartium quercuum f. sp. fusiforme G11]|uniref:Repressor of RNA polymerase III transcription MAF1 n=1 Tax=Cronartium quercuum f. sp. fusiforme G11 TaxID=708437 RepID=A0A9P6N736_9BASI|nr:hypothetical protein CROQUDRAFT_52293 [Cronartium quercuum f. sp. fusiforme G11]